MGQFSFNLEGYSGREVSTEKVAGRHQTQFSFPLLREGDGNQKDLLRKNFQKCSICDALCAAELQQALQREEEHAAL